MKQVDIFKQKIFTGDKKQMLFFWKAIKNMNKYISVFLIFFLNACISPSGYLSSDNSTSYYFDATNGSDDNNGTSPDKAWKNLAKTRRSETLPRRQDSSQKRGDIYRRTLFEWDRNSGSSHNH